jgi:integrase
MGKEPSISAKMAGGLPPLPWWMERANSPIATVKPRHLWPCIWRIMLALQGTLTRTRNETVEEFVLEWLQYCVQPKVREKTYLRYRELLTRHVLPTLGQLPLQRLAPKHLQKLYYEKQREGYAPQTIHQIHKLLSRALADAVAWNHVLRTICQTVKVPRLPRKEQSHALTVEQARQLLAAASGDPLEALYVLAITTGMREGELLALQWTDIDWGSKRIQVRRTLSKLPNKGLVIDELKTPSSCRCIQFTDLAVGALQQHALHQHAIRRQVEKAWVGSGIHLLQCPREALR